MADEQPRERWTAPEGWPGEPPVLEEPVAAGEWVHDPVPIPPPSAGPASAAGGAADAPEAPSDFEPLPVPPLFQHYEAPPPTPDRIPNFGHFCLLLVLIGLGFLCTGFLTHLALHQHLFGISSVQEAMTDIHYTLGNEAILYVFTLAGCLLLFPQVWHKSFFAGVQWNASTAFRLRWRLVSAAVACLVLAAISSFLVPGPINAPIDKIFRTPGAAWLLFGFGVTFAPFFEEMFFRGFVLPALATGVDWFGEKIAHQPRLPLGENGHPQWSFTAMAAASVATSIPFALMHAEQTGYSVGPFVLLAGVSLVLCAVRLSTRSLASSVLVHACYNFVLFSIMLIGTQGFRHLDKM